jgi:hypothetical protein
MKSRKFLVATGLAIAVTTALAVTGCGGDGDPQVASAKSPGARQATTSAAAGKDDVAAYVEGMRGWVACLRRAGIDVTDPDATGQVTFPGDMAALKADPKFTAAQKTCASVQPAIPDSVLDLRRPKLSQQQIETQRKYSECMQKNGAPDFPDPGPDGYPPRNRDWNQTAEGAKKAAAACASIIGAPSVEPSGQG